jgi:chromosome partitioning protein
MQCYLHEIIESCEHEIMQTIVINSQKGGSGKTMPCQASEDDLTAAPTTVRNLKLAGTPFLFVLTRVKANTLITAQAAAVLSKHGQVAETFVVDRTGYRSPYAKGQTVTEAEPRGPAAHEIAALWANIKSCLHENMKGANHG